MSRTGAESSVFTACHPCSGQWYCSTLESPTRVFSEMQIKSCHSPASKSNPSVVPHHREECPDVIQPLPNLRLSFSSTPLPLSLGTNQGLCPCCPLSQECSSRNAEEWQRLLLTQVSARMSPPQRGPPDRPYYYSVTP